MKKGFTLVELIVVVIILGILAGIGIPQYTRAVEKGKMREAEANLNVMYMAQKMFKLDNPTVGYVNCEFCCDDPIAAGWTACTTPYPSCNDILGIEMTKKYFNYYCKEINASNRFYCEAKRKKGRYADCKMAIDNTNASWYGKVHPAGTIAEYEDKCP